MEQNRPTYQNFQNFIILRIKIHLRSYLILFSLYQQLFCKFNNSVNSDSDNFPAIGNTVQPTLSCWVVPTTGSISISSWFLFVSTICFTFSNLLPFSSIKNLFLESHKFNNTYQSICISPLFLNL